MSDAVPPPPDEPAAPARPTRSSNGAAARGYDRVPPHSLDAEVSVLGAALLSRSAASDAVEVLRADDFYRNAHRIVFEAVQALTATGEPVDTVTITDWLARRDRLDEVGGPAGIHELTVAVPTAANANYYARIVREKALLRRLIDAGTEVVKLGYESVDDAEKVVDQAESRIYEVAQDNATSEYERLGDLLNVSFQQIEQLAERNSEVTGLATGFDDLDRLTAGLQPSNLVILAARPAMGKCLAGDTLVLEAGTGVATPIAELVRRGRAGGSVTVLALDGNGRLVPATVSEFHDNGHRATSRITTRDGRVVEATPNHPLLTPAGWREVADLRPGDAVAVPRGGAFPGHARSEIAAEEPLEEPVEVVELELTPIGPDGGAREPALQPDPAAPGQRTATGQDVLWDRVASVEDAGTQRVYDLTVPGLHCFVAADLIVHNSSLVLGVSHFVSARLSKPSLLFSLEMSKLEIVNRLLSSEARIDSSRLRTGRLEDTDWRKLGDALGTLAEAPMFIDDTPSITLMEIRAKSRRLKAKHGLDLIIVDYLQLMQGNGRADSRQQEVAEISRGLKMLAKELDVPVIALSQLSRQPEARTDKRPQLADLRESGSIEQDADIVGFIYRDEVYDEDSPDKGIAELIIAKHRNGATGVVRLAFLNHLTKFANLARGPSGSAGGTAI
jgi:replicative DNA helicase